MRSSNHRSMQTKVQQKQDNMLSSQDLVSSLKHKSKELKSLINYIGVSNVRFKALIVTLNNQQETILPNDIIGKTEFLECRIDESLFEIKDWYKITLVPVEDTGKYGYRHYYISDFITAIEAGEILIINK